MGLNSSLKYFVPAVIWAVVIVGLSSMPGVQLPAVKLFEVDKFAHAVVYGIFTWLILIGFRKKNQKTTVSWRQALIAFLVSSGWGWGMEWMQASFFPGRYFENMDEIANILGTILSILIFKLILKL